jgi:inner membrane protease ATP23
MCEDVFGGAPVGGAYDTGRKTIVLNARAPPSFLHQSEVTRAITHELVHAYDDCRAKVAWRDCSHLACTEVRAANLSGDCDFGVEFSRRPLGMLANAWAGHQGVCVRRRAEASLSQHAQCKEDAAFSVATVWRECYADMAPFSTN